MPFDLLEDAAAAESQPAVPPAAIMLQLLFGKHITYSLSAVARLGVADHMSISAPAAAEALAVKVNADAGSLYRVMRLLAGAGVFEETAGKCFHLTAVGELLRSDAAGSLRPFAIQLGDAWSTRPWEHFTETVKTGKDGVTQAFGKNAFEYLADEPEQAANFNRSMTGLSDAMVDPILRAYDFSAIRRLADVGGGHGSLLAAVLKQHPPMRGIVFDRPEVVAGAAGQPHVTACGNRIEFEAGNFFDRVPGGCDAYMMKFILHDWSDEHCVTILRHIQEQLPADGRVLVLEQLIDSQPSLSTAKLLDIEMLALTLGGRERTEYEFSELFAKAGLRLTRVFRTESPVCIIEAEPA